MLFMRHRHENGPCCLPRSALIAAALIGPPAHVGAVSHKVKEIGFHGDELRIATVPIQQTLAVAVLLAIVIVSRLPAPTIDVARSYAAHVCLSSAVVVAVLVLGKAVKFLERPRPSMRAKGQMNVTSTVAVQCNGRLAVIVRFFRVLQSAVMHQDGIRVVAQHGSARADRARPSLGSRVVLYNIRIFVRTLIRDPNQICVGRVDQAHGILHRVKGLCETVVGKIIRHPRSVKNCCSCSCRRQRLLVMRQRRRCQN